MKKRARVPVIPSASGNALLLSILYYRYLYFTIYLSIYPGIVFVKSPLLANDKLSEIVETEGHT
jgi:hypothetical protein